MSAIVDVDASPNVINKLMSLKRPDRRPALRYAPSKDQSWAHSCCSRAALTAALGDGSISAIETDLVWSESQSAVVHAHPPATASDLPFDAFLDAVCGEDARPAHVKLDFKMPNIVAPCVASIDKYYADALLEICGGFREPREVALDLFLSDEEWCRNLAPPKRDPAPAPTRAACPSDVAPQGYICPVCMVSFATPDETMDHNLETHTPPSNASHYDVLGVSRSIQQDAIKSAFRQVSLSSMPCIVQVLVYLGMRVTPPILG